MACPLPPNPPAWSVPTTVAPAARAARAVPSREPSSTTRTSSTRGRPPPAAVRPATIGATTPAMVERSSRAGTHTD